MSREKVFKTMDGNEAAAHIAYAFTEVAPIFPITPSSPMAEHVDEWAAHGRKNLFGVPVLVQEMQSEKGAAGTLHGALNAGALTTTFTSSQGMMIMLSNMFKVAGELLPAVFHAASRTIASNGYTIFAGHDDVMAMRGTGICMMAESSVQEVMDLAAVVHATAISCRVPIINFFDGFRTSHELQKIEVIDYEDLRPMLDMEAVEAFRKHAMNPDNPEAVAFCEPAEVYMQHKESLNRFYDKVPETAEKYMQMIHEITGREYHLFNYTGAPDAEYVIIAIGSGAQTIEETVRYLNEKGEKVGCINVHMFRPWSEKHFLAALPKTVKKIAVLERTKETGANGEPMYHSVAASFARAD
ncbi:MAG: pyruvate:ferredoxin (flavodoxin) oxidoreductase, partial [Megasphaera micronuciformis]|nr:pyruvate:ferredoxin (flavodoxin) oxidoreductase [Megasphaera micronuciformis]